MTSNASFAVRTAGVFGVPGATAVRVQDGRIAAVGGPEVLVEGEPLVEGGSGWLLPGLVDAHVHLGPGTSRGAALHGVTTVIDQFSTPDLLADELTRMAAAGSGECASVLAASFGATAPGGTPDDGVRPDPVRDWAAGRTPVRPGSRR